MTPLDRRLLAQLIALRNRGLAAEFSDAPRRL